MAPESDGHGGRCGRPPDTTTAAAAALGAARRDSSSASPAAALGAAGRDGPSTTDHYFNTHDQHRHTRDTVASELCSPPLWSPSHANYYSSVRLGARGIVTKASATDGDADDRGAGAADVCRKGGL